MNSTQLRLLLLGLVISPLFCYLEWGGGNSSFLFQAEYTILFGNKDRMDAFMHPFILLPVLGQLLILYNVFRSNPKRGLVIVGISFQAVLILFIFLVGTLSLNLRILSSTIPFLSLSIFYILAARVTRKS